MIEIVKTGLIEAARPSLFRKISVDLTPTAARRYPSVKLQPRRGYYSTR